MTAEEKLEMYKEKKRFIENLNDLFQIEPKCGSVVGVTYEVFTKDCGDGRIDTREWITVHYTGGGRAPRLVSGNSHTANFVVIGTMLNGGHYDDVRMYESQYDNNYVRVDL